MERGTDPVRALHRLLHRRTEEVTVVIIVLFGILKIIVDGAASSAMSVSGIVILMALANVRTQVRNQSSAHRNV